MPGSYQWSSEQRATFEEWLSPADIVAMKVPAGSVMLWRPTLLHSVTPNLSSTERKVIYVNFTPRWVRPSGHLEQNAELIARSSPVCRQLLGAMGNLSHPLGRNPVNNPNFQYWFTDDLGHRAAESVDRGTRWQATPRLGYRPARQPHQGSEIRVHAGDRPEQQVLGIVVG